MSRFVFSGFKITLAVHFPLLRQAQAKSTLAVQVQCTRALMMLVPAEDVWCHLDTVLVMGRETWEPHPGMGEVSSPL